MFCDEQQIPIAFRSGITPRSRAKQDNPDQVVAQLLLEGCHNRNDLIADCCSLGSAGHVILPYTDGRWLWIVFIVPDLIAFGETAHRTRILTGREHP